MLFNTFAVLFALTTEYLPNPKFGYFIGGKRFINLFSLLVLLPFVLLQDPGQRKLRIIAMVLVSVFFVALLIDQSRTHYLGFILGLLVILFLIHKRRTDHVGPRDRFLFAALSVTFLVTVVIFVLGVNNFVDSIYSRLLSVSDYDGDVSIQYRLAGLKTGVELFLKDPLFGIGTGQITYFDTGKLGGFRAATLHNFHLRFLVTGGIVSFVAFAFERQAVRLAIATSR